MEIIFRIGMVISLLSGVISLYMVCLYKYKVIKKEKIQNAKLIKIHPVIIIHETINDESIVIAEPIQPITNII